MDRIETFYGRIESEAECIILIDLARSGVIPRVQRRLTVDECRMIRSGSIFVYWEDESNIRRWTDDMSWTPSRVQGIFLVYMQRFSNNPLIKKTYSAVCGDKDFHVVSYSRLVDDVPGCNLVSFYYRNLIPPADIKVRRRLNFYVDNDEGPGDFMSSSGSIGLVDDREGMMHEEFSGLFGD
jgi:Gti1/Pac2 family transcription factor